MTQLQRLYQHLVKMGQDDEAEQLRQLMQETEEDQVWQDIQEQPDESDKPPFNDWQETERLKGVLPKFSWLLRGNLFKDILRRDKIAYEDFLDANSDALIDFNEPTYLGSGAMADAWLVDGERVLKIFDINSYAGVSEPSYKQYQDMYSAQWYDRDSKSLKDPMIYGLGLFDTPFRISQMMTKGGYARGYMQLAWVLMERVITIDDLSKKYIKDSGTDINPEIENDPPPENEDGEWELDDWTPEKENPNFKMRELYDIFENSYMLREGLEAKVSDNWRAAKPSDMISYFVAAFVDSAIWDVHYKVEEYKDEEYEYADDKDDYDSEEEWLDDRLDFEDEEQLRGFVESLIDDLIGGGADGESVISEESTGLVERILGINQRADLEEKKISGHGTSSEWLVDIVMEAVRKTEQGYGDTHTGNFGFRKEKDKEGNFKNRPIFFDA